MNRRTSQILSRVLPIVFWTLAVAGTVGVPFLLSSLNLQFHSFNTNYWWGFAVAALVLSVIVILGRVDRFALAVAETFQIALLLGIASYWLPTVLFLTIPVIIFLIVRNHFNMRSFTAMLVGFMTIAIWAAVFIVLGWIENPWLTFFAIEQVWGWIPTGSILLAWLASLISQRALRVR